MFIDLVKKSRSYRGFDRTRLITAEELAGFVDCARFAPSSVNGQPFKYIIMNDCAETARLQKLTGWARALPDMTLPHPGKEPTAFIVICQNTDWDADLNRYQRDVGIAAQTILLAAADAGLGGIMIGNFSPKRVSEEFALPGNIVPMLIVALGKPDENIVLTEVSDGESIRYYRDENDTHYVPKRKLDDIIMTV